MWRKSARTPGRFWRGSGVVVPDSNRLKPPRWPSRLRSKEAREPGRVTHRAPPAHRMHRLRGRRARQSGSPTGLLGGPEALIYQRLSLTPTGGSGGPRAPCPSWSILSGWELRTLALSAASFRSITCSQKEVTALFPLSLVNSAPKIAGGERFHPISTMRSRRGRAHTGQNSNVCCAESTLASQ